MTPRVTDWTLAACVGVALATGVASLDAGQPALWWVFALHGIAGIALALFLIGKLRRVLPRLVHRRLWNRGAIIGAATTLAALMTLGSGIWWIAGGVFDALGFGLLNWHITLGFGLAVLVGLHMLARAKPLRPRDLTGRRQALRWLGFASIGAALWPAQQHLAGSARRFTGSRATGDFAGNAYPATSWVADRPRPLDPATYRLAITGAVLTPFTTGCVEIAGDDALTATLDCTGGFASTQRWRGTRVGALLERAGVGADGGWVRFHSVTGYRWSLPMAEARNALLATHVGEEPLSHAHGAPVRLVAPGRRGFQWVKWVVAVEVLAAPDLGQIAAIHTSSFTPTGRGE